MLRFLRLAALPLALLLALLTAVSVAVGGLHAAHPMSTQLTWCEGRFICWLGISTTTTSMDDARSILTTAGYQSDDAHPGYYTLQTAASSCIARMLPIAETPSNIGALGVECDELRLSEIMGALGEPDRVGSTCDGGYIFYYGRNLFINIGKALSPNQRVETMVFSQMLTGYYRPRWYGFALPWLYADRTC